MIGRRLLLAFLAASLCHAARAQGDEAGVALAQGTAFRANARVEIDSQGKVTQVLPDPAQPPSVRDLLAARLMEWQFAPPSFQGRPVATNAQLQLALQPAPVTTGGYAIRILGGGPAPVALDTIPVIRFEGRAPKGPTTLVYVVSIDAEGRVSNTDLVFPEKKSRSVRPFVEPVRFALEHAPPFQRTVDGQPVACRLVFRINFNVDSTSATPNELDIPGIEATLPDLCPTIRLLTKVEGTTL